MDGDEDGSAPGVAVITAVRQVGRRKQRLVQLSDGRQFVFTEEAVDRAGLRPGMQATDAVFAALEAADRRAAAHEAALRLLATRARSEQELRTRLSMRGYEPQTVDEEIERLRRAGLIDDASFAQAWVRHRQASAPRGQRMLRYELVGRGIDPAAAGEATRDIDDREVALTLARRRARSVSATDYESFLARVGGFLSRRGFTYAVAAEVVREVWRERSVDTRPGDDPD